MVLNVPNILTLIRLLLIPIFAYGALSESLMLRIAGALAFGIAAATDWLDGYAARRFNQVTEFGKVADPIVDRILIASVLVVLYLKISALVPLWAVAVVIGRDFLMVVGWLYLSGSGTRVAVTREGKVATAILMTASFILLASADLSATAQMLGVVLFYIGVVFSLVSGIQYARLAIGVSQSGKAHS